MSRLKWLISEIHRRSLWQVLLIYIGAAWACYELIDAVTDRLALPAWLPGLAIILFLLGLPFVVATAFVREEFTTAALPAEATEAEAERAEAEAATARHEATRRHRFLTWRNAGLSFVFALALWGVVAAGWLLVGRRTEAAPEERRSLAVLPFENLSGDESADPFTNGIHDDIITHLSLVGDLKVISRTSVMEYRGRTANLRQIAEELDVGAVLEGGVQRAGDRVRVNVQLINARTDEHLWAETFDRALTAENVFSIQSEIARSVAQALRAELSAEEERRVDARPTDNLQAYDYYTRALDLPGGVYGDLPLKIQLVARAIELDPDFVQAYTALSAFHIWMYHGGRDPTPARLDQAKATAERAIELDPAFYGAHFALGQYYYLGHRDYPRALAEFRAAAALNPNADVPIRYVGAIQRRTGEWEEALANIQRAAELDPRSVGSVEELAVTYQFLRRYEEAIPVFDRAIALVPDRSFAYTYKAYTHLSHEGSREKAWQVLEAHRENTGSRFPGIAGNFMGRAALRVLHVYYKDALRRWTLATSRDTATYYLLRALSFMLTEEAESSTAYFDSTRVVLERKVSELPDYSRFHASLGVAYAGLGRKEEAIREAQTAVELLPVSRDAVSGPDFVGTLAEIYAMVGEYDAAIAQLEYLLSIPCLVSPALLRIDPVWDPLRDHPRFQALLQKYE